MLFETEWLSLEIMLPLLIMLRRCLLKCRCNVYVVCVCVCVCVCLLCVIRFIVYVPNVVRNKSHYYIRQVWVRMSPGLSVCQGIFQKCSCIGDAMLGSSDMKLGVIGVSIITHNVV